MPTLDINFVRSNFPAFSSPSLKGWAFFENAGGSYPCHYVISRLTDFYTHYKVQPYGPYPASQIAGQAMDEAYTKMAGYLNVSEDEVHLGPSTSQNTYVLANAFRGMWQEGDEIVVSTQDHEANAGAWRRLAQSGIVVKEWHVNQETGMLDPSDLDNLLTSKTKLLAFPHCSNVIGHVNPVADIVARGHAVGAHVVADGVAYAPHGLPDVDALGVDVYLFSTYKTFGPHQGLMVVRRPLFHQLTNQSHYFNADAVHKKLIPAGPDHAQVAAVAGIADYFDAVYEHHFDEEADRAERGRKVHQLIEAHEKELLTPLMGWLSNRNDVQIIGPADPELRAPTVSIIPKNKSIPDVIKGLEHHKIMANAGNFYAVRPLNDMNIPLETGVLRLSFVHYTNEAEIEQLIGALDASL